MCCFFQVSLLWFPLIELSTIATIITSSDALSFWSSFTLKGILIMKDTWFLHDHLHTHTPDSTQAHLYLRKKKIPRIPGIKAFYLFIYNKKHTHAVCCE